MKYKVSGAFRSLLTSGYSIFLAKINFFSSPKTEFLSGQNDGVTVVMVVAERFFSYKNIPKQIFSSYLSFKSYFVDSDNYVNRKS